MAKSENTVMAGCLDEKTSLYFIFIANLILAGFYYAFAGMDAMRFSALAFSLCVFCDLFNSCGFAFGEAAFAARAAMRNDYKTALYVRRLTCLLIFGCAGLFFIIMAAAGRPLAGLILGSQAPAEDITYLYTVMILCGLYALVSGALTWLRGFYQGMGENRVDQRSQLLNCAALYIFALIVMVIMVFGMHLNRSLCVYGLCIALILAKLLTLAYYMLFEKIRFKKYRAMAKAQMIPPMNRKKVFSSLLSFCAPSLCMAICAGLGLLVMNCGIYHTAAAQAVKYVNAIDYHGLSGWMIPLFACIPVLFAFAQFERYAPLISRSKLGEEKKCAVIEKMIIRYLAYALPYCFVLGCLGPELIHLFYGNDFLADPLLIMRIESAGGLLAGLSVLTARTMIILGLGHNALSYALISLAAHIGLFILAPMRFGMEGMLYAYCVALSIFLFLCFTKITNRHEVSFVRIFIMSFRLILSCMAMNGVYALVRFAGLNTMSGDLLFDGLFTAGMLLGGAVIYTFVLSVSGIRLRDGKKRKKKSE